MRIVIAPDSFKESASAAEVCEAMAEGVRRACPEAEIVTVPMADGGEGTVAALVSATSGRLIPVTVRGPVGLPVEAEYGILGDGRTAVLEVAAACGLALAPEAERAPGYTTSYGVGEMLRHAMEQAVAQIIVGLGGSATNDAGAGMAQALGYSLRDRDDHELPFGGLALSHLEWIDDMKKHKGIDNVEVVGASDVTNPLCGPSGASVVYGPQKGATPDEVEKLDAALRHFGELVEEEFDIPVLDTPGAGAAGGLGAGLMTFMHATLRPGFDVVAEACDLKGRMEGADLVITGEGKLDAQSLRGKTPVGVARLARGKGIPVVALVGMRGEEGLDTEVPLFDKVVTTTSASISPDESRDRVLELLGTRAEELIRQWPDSAQPGR